MSNTEPWIAEMPRRELRQHAKPTNFDLPSMPIPMHAAGLVLELAVLITTSFCRRQYADEREIPEYIDHGGES